MGKCHAFTIIGLLILSVLITACGGGEGDDTPEIQSYQLHGLNFSPYMEGQDPNTGIHIHETQLRQRMEIIQPNTNGIRTFGSANGLEKCGAVARSLGLSAALGAWIGKDLAANEQEIENLIAAAQAGDADLLIVGNEVLLRGDLTEDAMIAYIRRVKQAVPDLQVSYADVYSKLLDHPDILAAVDVVLVNYYPYWEGISIDIAVATLHFWHDQISTASNGKQVIVGETGWPSAGDTIGRAVPSAENAAYYFMNFISWARANAIEYFYFEAFDEPWKAAYEGPQGAHWGVWDKNGTLKPGMQPVFDGQTMEDNWSGSEIACGPGKPSIAFTYVPPYGSLDDLEGQACHIKPSDYKIAVYIFVTGWWTKPTFAKPLTPIRVDGSWLADITTGGIDERATRITAFLLPAGYEPPRMSGGATLPSELDDNAVAKVEATRGP